MAGFSFFATVVLPPFRKCEILNVLWSRIILSPFCRVAVKYETCGCHGFLFLLQIPSKMDAFTVWSCLDFPKATTLQSKLQLSVLTWILCRAKTWTGLGIFFSIFPSEQVTVTKILVQKPPISLYESKQDEITEMRGPHAPLAWTSGLDLLRFATVPFPGLVPMPEGIFSGASSQSDGWGSAFLCAVASDGV